VLHEMVQAVKKIRGIWGGGKEKENRGKLANEVNATKPAKNYNADPPIVGNGSNDKRNGDLGHDG